MLPTWAKESIIRLRPGSKVSRGSTVPDWDNPARLTIDGCSVQPATTSLSRDGRVLGVSEGLTIYLPPGADVKAGDRIVANGEVYEMTGDPKTWRSATGLVSNTQISVERWRG
jgi:hypothetical protein